MHLDSMDLSRVVSTVSWRRLQAESLISCRNQIPSTTSFSQSKLWINTFIKRPTFESSIDWLAVVHYGPPVNPLRVSAFLRPGLIEQPRRGSFLFRLAGGTQNAWRRIYNVQKKNDASVNVTVCRESAAPRPKEKSK